MRTRVIRRAASSLGLALVAAYCGLTQSPAGPVPYDGVCRSLLDPARSVSVPDDVMIRSAAASEVRLSELSTPTTRQLTTTRTVLDKASRDEIGVGLEQDYTACLVSYSRTGRATDPHHRPPIAAIIARDNVPALLLYHAYEALDQHCFGGPCPPGGSTHPVGCAFFVAAETGALLRVESCWDLRAWTGE
ncbi:hypothetical protein H5V45_16020 [Nocardioides sp. KIGAM211]|uniref:Uncharacterized protein n=1 Tax=Nocardioides luti TaxID=2761101 RepID=A0A7X0RKC1_9ACTN|nr:hypothetical protein [Nocardioides luti]MBB6628835.1 hypothetical protein [Nocardioides luti]